MRGNVICAASWFDELMRVSAACNAATTTETHERQRAHPLRDAKFKAGLQPLDVLNSQLVTGVFQ